MHSIQKRQYYVPHIPACLIENSNFKINLPYEMGKIDAYTLNMERQDDNQLFRIVRNRTGTDPDIKKGEYIQEIAFVEFEDCRSEVVRRLVEEGFILNNKHYLISERSGNMSRYGSASFLESETWFKCSTAINLGLDTGASGIEVVPSKWFAQKGLLLSSCRCIEDEAI